MRDMIRHARTSGLTGRRRGRLALLTAAALTAFLGLGPLAGPAGAASATGATAATGAAAAAETPLSETGWVASSNTSSGSGDVPANAIDGNISTRFSSDADQASGMYFQVNMGSAQTFNQIEMNSGGSTGDYARGYNVEVSTNGTTFTSVATGTGTSSPRDGDVRRADGPVHPGGAHRGLTTNWWSIAEFTGFTTSGERHVRRRRPAAASARTSPCSRRACRRPRSRAR